MNPALVQYHDDRLSECAAITSASAMHFAQTYGLDYVQESGSTNMTAHMKKVELSLRELNAGRPYVVYADTDTVFNKELDPTFLPSFCENSMSMTSIGGGFQTSFFIVKNDDVVKAFLAQWLEYGMPVGVGTDEPSFYRTCRQYRNLANSIAPIPTSLISQINVVGSGSIGRHFRTTSQLTSTYVIRQYAEREV